MDRRATFAHTSSSADLTATEHLHALRSFPSHPSWDVSSKPREDHDQGLRTSGDNDSPGPLTHWPYRRDDDDYANGLLASSGLAHAPDSTTPRRRAGSYPSGSRSPSPNPFRVPELSIPGYNALRFISLCSLWYLSSALSSNTGKVILNRFRYPVTLTIVQFFFVAGYCIVCSPTVFGWTGRLRSPTKAILRGTLPMAVFQVGGHIFGSLAISRVPVSTVHTIKALSPLFTVLAYALLFRVSYSPATYFSLLPLTMGVMLACSFDIKISNILGLVCAFGSTLVFVSQNIFFKKIMPTKTELATGAGVIPLLDKTNLLFFSSGLAFLLMTPVWLYSDCSRVLHDWRYHIGGPEDTSILLYLFLNGTVHFAQNLLAFTILSSTSPVTYSVASLVKRIAVICLAIVWFKQAVHTIQAIGICLTAIGLVMYNNAKRDVEKGKRQMRHVEAVREGLLPTSKLDERPGMEGRGAVIGLPYGKDIHSSPKPYYTSNFATLSKSSAVRPLGFARSSTTDSMTVPVDAPYPSSLASAASSPSPHDCAVTRRPSLLADTEAPLNLPLRSTEPILPYDTTQCPLYQPSRSPTGVTAGA